jgi:hypothetical protein
MFARDTTASPPQDAAMTLGLVLTLALAQVDPSPVDPVPAQNEPPPEARLTPPPPAPAGPSVLTRSLLSTGGGTLAGGAALGIGLLLVGGNPLFDPTFATAALSALLVTGVAFSIHAALGGKGEITLALLIASAVMAGAGLAATAITSDRLLAPVVVAAIGALPAAALATFGLEGTSPKPKTRVAISVAPNGVFATF